MLIEVTRDSSPITRRRWTFLIDMRPDEVVVVLNSYVSEGRASMRSRKWSADREYARHNNRILSKMQKWIPDPPVPKDVRDEVIDRMLQRVKFKVPGGDEG